MSNPVTGSDGGPPPADTPYPSGNPGAEPTYPMPAGVVPGAEPTYPMPAGVVPGAEPTYPMPAGVVPGAEPTYPMPAGVVHDSPAQPSYQPGSAAVPGGTGVAGYPGSVAPASVPPYGPPVPGPAYGVPPAAPPYGGPVSGGPVNQPVSGALPGQPLSGPPGYAVPYGYPPQPPAGARKSRAALVLAIVAGLLFVAGGLMTGLFIAKSGELTKTESALTSQIADRDSKIEANGSEIDRLQRELQTAKDKVKDVEQSLAGTQNARDEQERQKEVIVKCLNLFSDAMTATSKAAFDKAIKAAEKACDEADKYL